MANGDLFFMGFFSDRHPGCPHLFDEEGGQLAHVAIGQIHFDDAEPWKEDQDEDGVHFLQVSPFKSIHVWLRGRPLITWGAW